MNKKTKRIAFISSFLPRKCGIATFASDLIRTASLASKSQLEPLVIAMSNENGIQYKHPVKFEIRQNVRQDYICAADYINFSHVDLVSVQHEFGLFGPNAGAYLTLLLQRLNAPIVTTLHTVLDEPDIFYRKSTIDLCNASEKVIVMNEKGIEMLDTIYGISGPKVMLIPHGIPDLPFVDNNYYKHKFAMEGRRTILTFGLLSKNKGIETMLKAMPQIIKADPSVLYVVLGMTHPSVLKHDGEAYRFRLQKMVNDLNIQDHVIFNNRFVSDEQLHNFLCAADIYVTPYLSKEQLTSGTLSFAVGTGKAVVSTPYWAALELLADDRGIIFNFGDSDQLAKEIIRILSNDKLFYSLRRKAYDYSRSKTWPKIGAKYWKLFSEIKQSININTETKSSKTDLTHPTTIPEISLDHLKRLTDDTGIYQHAKMHIPNRKHGYCTDDNARALIVMTTYCEQYQDPNALNLLDTYLSFLLHAQKPEGSIKNFMNFDRSWLSNEPENDALGRFLWALGYLIANPPSTKYIPIIKDLFDKAVKLTPKLHPRTMAYSILAMYYYLQQFPGASDIKRYLADCANSLLNMFQQNSSDNWLWFESQLTYDNAILPCALFIASLTIDKTFALPAQSSCDFLLEKTFIDNHFSFVGCNGWCKKGSQKADFDQQPIEAFSTILMLKAAFEATNNHKYIILQRKAFDWFLGDNDIGKPVYNFITKGCHDGLRRTGVNENQGAESTLSFLMSLLALNEGFCISPKTNYLPNLNQNQY